MLQSDIIPGSKSCPTNCGGQTARCGAERIYELWGGRQQPAVMITNDRFEPEIS